MSGRRSATAVRLSRILRQTDLSPTPERIPVARAVGWALFALLLVAGVLLYFRYERLLVPLLS